MVGRHESTPAGSDGTGKVVLIGWAASQACNDFDSCQRTQVLRQSGFWLIICAHSGWR